MFTGLIQDIGKVQQIADTGTDRRLVIETRLGSFAKGESIAVAGVCLSVENFNNNSFAVFASNETLAKSTILELKPSSMVNLEKALKVGDSIGGHFVSGHVDTRVKLLSRNSLGSAEQMFFSMPEKDIALQLAPKGSVAIDGVSLTVNEVGTNSFSVMIIPITLKETTLNLLCPGDRINLETDVLAKYIARQLNGQKESKIDIAFLERTGFIR